MNQKATAKRLKTRIRKEIKLKDKVENSEREKR